MEDILALVIVCFFIAALYVVVRASYKRYQNIKKEEAERRARSDKFWAEQRAKINKVEVPDTMKKYASALGAAPKVAPPPPKKTETTYTSTTSTRRTDDSDDGFVTGMLTGMLLDSAINSFKHGTDPDTGVTYDREVERSVGVNKSESSWGFDDSDSRKSISDSMSSSWSSSSSDFGSSDSGPSSDW